MSCQVLTVVRVMLAAAMMSSVEANPGSSWRGRDTAAKYRARVHPRTSPAKAPEPARSGLAWLRLRV